MCTCVRSCVRHSSSASSRTLSTAQGRPPSRTVRVRGMNKTATRQLPPQHRCTGYSQCTQAAWNPTHPTAPEQPSHSSNMHKRPACRTAQALLLSPHTPSTHTPKCKGPRPLQTNQNRCGHAGTSTVRICLLSSVISLAHVPRFGNACCTHALHTRPAMATPAMCTIDPSTAIMLHPRKATQTPPGVSSMWPPCHT